MPHTGRTFTLLKCPGHPQFGKIAAENGVVVPAAVHNAAQKAEVAARYAAHGKLHDSAFGLEGKCEAGLIGEAKVVVWSALQPKPEPPIAPGVKATALSVQTLLALADSQVSLLGLCASAKASTCTLFQQAPAAAMTVPCKSLKKLGTEPDVAGIFADDSQGVPGGNTFPYSVAAIPLFWYGGSLFIGSGNGVCVLEPYAPSAWYLSFYPGNTTIRPNGLVGATWQQSHAAMCGGAVKSTDSIGIAFGADLFFATYAATSGTYASQVQTGTNWCASQNVRNWSFSQVAYEGSDVVQDTLFDYSARQPPYPMVAAMSGNLGVNKKAAHRYIYNGLVVGGSDEHGSAVRVNHTMWDDNSESGSQSENNSGYSDREVPHIVAPAKNLDAAGTMGWTGTSFAAPQVAAAGALLDQIGATYLSSWPEAKRAILMAGANRDLDYIEVPDPNVDTQDGAGEMNVTLAMTIAEPIHKHAMNEAPDRYGYDFTSVDKFGGQNNDSDWLNQRCPVGVCGVSNGHGYRIHVPSAPTGLRVRAVLAWDGTACGGGAWNQSCVSSYLDADLDLWVCRAGTTSCVASASVDNSWEIVQFQGIPGQDYDIFIQSWGFHANVFYTDIGLAWAVDDFSN